MRVEITFNDNAITNMHEFEDLISNTIFDTVGDIADKFVFSETPWSVTYIFENPEIPDYTRYYETEVEAKKEMDWEAVVRKADYVQLYFWDDLRMEIAQ